MYQKTRERHGDRLLKVYAARPRNVAEAFAEVSARRADCTAVVDGDRRLSFAQLDAAAGSVAAGLAARGFGAGDRLAVLLPNCVQAVIAVIAAARLGGIVVPVGMNLREPEIRYIFEDAAPAALVFDAARAAELPPPNRAGPAGEMRFHVGGAVEGTEPFATLTAHAGEVRSVALAEDDAFGILYTSGTTGRPKGAVLSHLNVVHSALHWREVHQLREGEVAALTIPWSHVAGLCGVVLPILMLGGSLVMMREFRAPAFLDLVATEKVTHALLVPAMYGLCLLQPDMASRDLSSWRLGVFGGAPMPEATIRRFGEAVPHLRMCNAYGATETSSPATIMPLDVGTAHLDSIGLAVPCGDIVVMRENGSEAEPGEAGELWIGGPMIVAGYWNNPEATARSFVAGYWLSGDIGSVDADGFVRILDRKKDMVNRGGYKIYPAEVENHLMEHPDVIEAAVVGRPDEILTERVVAFIRAKRPGLTAEALATHCEAAMADYKIPDFFVVADDPLPRNANGKIQKQQLREIAGSLPAHAARAGVRR